MLSSIFIILGIETSIKINGFLYFLRKLPFLKSLLNNTSYSFLGIKEFSTTLSIIYKIVIEPIKSILTFFLSIYLPVSFVIKQESGIDEMFFLIASFYLLFALLNSILIGENRQKFIMVKQMKMNPKNYCKASLFLEEILTLISMTLVFIMFLTSRDINPIVSFSIALIIVSFSIFAESLHLYIFKRTDFSINNSIYAGRQILLFLVVLVLSYWIALFTEVPDLLNVSALLTSSLSLVLFLPLGIFGLIYINKYDNYSDVVNEGCTVYNLSETKETVKEIVFDDVKIKEDDFKNLDLANNFSSKNEGYSYLNDIFFSRHKKIVYKPMVVKSVIVFLSFLTMILVDVFTEINAVKKLIDLSLDYYNIFFIISFILCDSSRLIKSLFYNCDRSLLRYGFYKRGDALLKMFFLRLRKIIFSNFIPTLILCLGLVVTTYFYNVERIKDVVPILILILSLSLFFSIHYIFMYYMFQPFATSLEVKNPFYVATNWIIYFICYKFTKIQLSSQMVLKIIVLAVIMYIIVAIVLVYKKSPKTFRTK